MEQKHRGLRFLFSAAAEIIPEGTPSSGVSARVVELSLRECYMETPMPFGAHTPVLVKIFNLAEYFEAKATVIHVKPGMGVRLAFREVNPHFLATLQKWILAAMHTQKKPETCPP